MKRVLKVNQESINAALPSIPQDFEQDMRHLIACMPEQRKEQPVMKRKLSVVLVLAVVLTLIAVGAVAAVLLGGKDFVDQIMAPAAAINPQEERYTSAEVDEILKKAEENGIELPDHIISRLEASDDGEFKEELMRQFVKTEYGFYPSAWPLEVQHWYEATVEACGQGDGYIHNVLPEGEDELSQEEAIAAAIRHIQETYGETANLEDPARYRRHMTYTETIVNPYLTERNWYFEYHAYHPEDNVYYLTMGSDGAIKKSHWVAGVYGASKDMGGNSITARFAWAYTDGYGGTQWTTEILQEYQDALQYRVAQEGEAGITNHEKHALYQVYLTPDEQMISRDAAIEKAMAACEGYEIMPGYGEFPLAICLNTEEGPAWKVKLTLKRGENRLGRAYVELDAYTGAVKTCDTSFEYSMEWREIVSESYWEKNKPENKKTIQESVLADRPTARPDNKPGIWYSDVAPDWYWEKLDAVGYNADTAGDLMNFWQNTYGEDSLFWPLEAQAIDYLWHEIYYSGATSFPGLPSEQDITQELAIQLGKNAFEKQYGEALGETSIDLDQAICGVSYWFNQPYDGKNCWKLTLKNPTGGEIGSVLINARTGEAEKFFSAWQGGFVLVHPATPAPSPTPRADGKPWMWGDEIFPAEYWARLEKAMEKHGVTFDNIDEKAAEWKALYPTDIPGTDDYFAWPQELKAIYYTLRRWEEGDHNTYMILPEENGITEEQAAEIAWKAFREVCQGQVEEEWVNGLEMSLCLWSNDSQNHGKSKWVIQFHEKIDEFNTRGWVSLDGVTGEVLLAELDLFSNG